MWRNSFQRIRHIFVEKKHKKFYYNNLKEVLDFILKHNLIKI